MNRYTYQSLNSAILSPTVVGIGNFDGVHRGHQALINMVTEKALARGLLPSILTFDPHPLRFFKGRSGPAQVYSSTDRAEVLSHLESELFLLKIS